MDKIKILKVEPWKPPCVKEIANDFKASQAEVEGDIECVGFGDGCVAVINAEGKLILIRENTNKLSTQQLSAGIYVVKAVSHSGEKLIRKIVIN